jgi:hypothetical protein
VIRSQSATGPVVVDGTSSPATPGPFRAFDRTKGVILAAIAGLALSEAEEHDDEARHTVQAALTTQTMIGQAQVGGVMGLVGPYGGWWIRPSGGGYEDFAVGLGRSLRFALLVGFAGQ